MQKIIKLSVLLFFFTFGSACGQPISKSAKSKLFREKTLELAYLAAKPPMLIEEQTSKFIVLDPGHGGHDMGTQSISKPRYKEKSFNLVTANLVSRYLQQAGYKVVMTRQDDTFVSLEKRAELANEQKPDLFLSIHYNSAPSAEANGVEVFYFNSKENKTRTLKSKKAAQAILKNVIKITSANSRGVKSGNFLVIRETKVPAILIEGGFLSNQDELIKIKDPDYLKKLAWGISKGVEDYFKKN